MFQKKPEGQGPVKSYGVLVGIRVEEGGQSTLADVENRIHDALNSLPDVGDVITEILGEIAEFEEPSSDTPTPDDIDPTLKVT